MVDYLVTGGLGFIGTNLVNYLTLKDRTVRVIDLSDKPSNLLTSADVSVTIPNIQCDTLVHLASETNVRDSIVNPRNTIERNISGILNCLEMARLNDVRRFIFTSSLSAPLSSSPYLASKMSCESICYAYRRSYSLSTFILRLSNVYGPHSTHKQSVVARFIKNCLNKEPLTVTGDGSQQRDFIHVDDVVSAIYNKVIGNISTGILTGIGTLANMISEISLKLINYKPRITYVPKIRGEVDKQRFIDSDIIAPIPLEKGLTDTFKWFMKNY